MPIWLTVCESGSAAFGMSITRQSERSLGQWPLEIYQQASRMSASCIRNPDYCVVFRNGPEELEASEWYVWKTTPLGISWPFFGCTPHGREVTGSNEVAFPFIPLNRPEQLALSPKSTSPYIRRAGWTAALCSRPRRAPGDCIPDNAVTTSKIGHQYGSRDNGWQVSLG